MRIETKLDAIMFLLSWIVGVPTLLFLATLIVGTLLWAMSWVINVAVNIIMLLPMPEIFS